MLKQQIQDPKRARNKANCLPQVNAVKNMDAFSALVAPKTIMGRSGTLLIAAAYGRVGNHLSLLMSAATLSGCSIR
jgi:hypothetical protein